MRYLRHGDGSEIVVLIHGFGGDLTTWLFNAEALAGPGRSVYAFDLPGHGGSSKDVGAGTVAELAETLQAALDALSPEFRAAVVLCDIEGLSYEEVGATLGIKLGTVRSRIHRGRAQLRTALAHRRRPAADGRAPGVPE